jgi:predicted SAM-dependent methyltransferase
MLSRGAKDAFYKAAGPIMKVNGMLYRGFRAPRQGPLRVQLGPGQSNYLPGWINVDANKFTGRCDVWADLRNPLPFRDGTVGAMYSHHVIEHLPDLERHFRDVFRCLQPGGVYRVGGPSGDNAIRKFVEGDKDWFYDYPDARTSLGGKFENFIFCRNEHLTILTDSYLEEIMTGVGFTNLRRCRPIKETHHRELFADCLAKEWETDEDCPHTLLIEAEKPA